MRTQPDMDQLLACFIDATRQAAARVLADWQSDLDIRRKADGSPVTETDAAAERIISTCIRAACDYPIVAEEEFEAGLTGQIDPAGTFVLIDALDGTREFIRKLPDFTVNVALVTGGVPVLGVIAAPAHGGLWHGVAGQGSYSHLPDGTLQRLRVRAVPDAGVAVMGGKRAHENFVLEPYVKPVPVASRTQRSSSLKFCLLAEGVADVYPRFGDTYEWDTAAGDIILREAGGQLVDVTTRCRLTYGKQERRFLNPSFIAGATGLFTLQP